MKKYTTPEFKMIKVNNDDIIQTSGIITITTEPKIFDGAVKLDEQSIDIFSE